MYFKTKYRQPIQDSKAGSSTWFCFIIILPQKNIPPGNSSEKLSESLYFCMQRMGMVLLDTQLLLKIMINLERFHGFTENLSFVH